MCEFISWIEHDGSNYFLTSDDLETKEGKKLLLPDVVSNISGHGAIENYYPEIKNKGLKKECTDFSSPDNFPPEIVTAIKKGKFTGIGKCFDILINTALAEYSILINTDLAEYNKIINTDLAEYDKIRNTALAEYDKILNTAFWKIAIQEKNRKINWR